MQSQPSCREPSQDDEEGGLLQTCQRVWAVCRLPAHHVGRVEGPGLDNAALAAAAWGGSRGQGSPRWRRLRWVWEEAARSSHVGAGLRAEGVWHTPWQGAHKSCSS